MGVDTQNREYAQMAETLNLTISGMSCGHCVSAIDRALTGLDGVLTFDIQIGSARVAIDEKKIPRAKLFATIRETGAFDVTGFAAADD